MALRDDVAAGHRQALEALRDQLAAELEQAVGRDVASLSRELRATLAELEGLPVRGEESSVDDLASRREARRAASGM
jgi:hypothetical protein